MCDTPKCNTCNAPKEIKESVGCNADRLFNTWEVFKSGFLKGIKINYEPQFQCRFADLIENIQEEKQMIHKCDGCEYKGEHQEMMFRPMGVCHKEQNLLEAVKAYNAEKRPFEDVTDINVVYKSGWISVEDRLPDKSGNYLYAKHVWDDAFVYGVLNYSAKHKLFNTRDEVPFEEAKLTAIEVTHWMPLPEPPKMKGGAE